MVLNARQSYAVAPQVSVRPERFGGLVYRYDNRALYFLHSRPLVELLLRLDGDKSLDATLDIFAAEREMSESDRTSLENALGQLEGKGVIREL